MIFQYDVPENWYPFDDFKQTLVRNLIENGNEKKYGTRISGNNTIGILADLNAGSIRIYVNGKDQGLAISNN